MNDDVKKVFVVNQSRGSVWVRLGEQLIGGACAAAGAYIFNRIMWEIDNRKKKQ